MDTIPQLGDVWYPKPDAKYPSPPFIIVEVHKGKLDDATYHKIIWLESKNWCWYGTCSIVKDYYLVGRI